MTRGGALILTYHAVEAGSSPLCVEPHVLRGQLDVLCELEAMTMTVSELAAALRAGELPPRAVALTFDDGCASAVRVAAPLLAERRQTATFFCVAGHLGGWNDWPTQPTGVPRLELATAGELGDLGALGFEIGAHGVEHMPLDRLPDTLARREIRESQTTLEEAIGTEVRSFAFPYGVSPSPVAGELVAELYDAACAATVRRVTATSNPFALPRVDAHYVRHPRVFRRVAVGGFDSYLRARGLAHGVRRRL